jgi:anti-anti-sigma factor
MLKMDTSILRVCPLEDFTIYNVEELTRELLKSLATTQEVSVDLSQTEKIDTAGFQLLVSLKKNCLESGKKFDVVGMNDTVENFMTLFGYEIDAKQKGDT